MMLTCTVFNNEPDVRPFSAGQMIFEQGQPGDVMYAVLEGEAEINRQNRVLEMVTPGGVFGEMALIDQHPRSASAIGKKDGRVAAITAKRFQRWCGKTHTLRSRCSSSWPNACA
jgi:CRP-like cAMP-binding protein